MATFKHYLVPHKLPFDLNTIIEYLNDKKNSAENDRITARRILKYSETSPQITFNYESVAGIEFIVHYRKFIGNYSDPH